MDYVEKYDKQELKMRKAEKKRQVFAAIKKSRDLQVQLSSSNSSNVLTWK